jgi:hypothetical protein
MEAKEIKHVRCERCGEWHWNTRHCNCKPFTILFMGHKRDIVYSRSFEDAAEKYAKDYNERGAIILNAPVFGSPMQIVDENGAAKWFTAFAEAEISYLMTEVPEPEED